MFLTIYLTPRPLILIMMVRTLGLIPLLVVFAILLYIMGHTASCQSCTTEVWHGTGVLSILAFIWHYATSHPAHFQTTLRRLCHAAQHDTLPPFPCLTIVERKWNGEERREELKD